MKIQSSISSRVVHLDLDKYKTVKSPSYESSGNLLAKKRHRTVHPLSISGRESDMTVGWEGSHDSPLMTDGEDGRTTREHGSTWRRCGGETPGGVCRHCVPPADCRSPPLLNGYVSPRGVLTTQHTVYCLHAGCQCSGKSPHTDYPVAMLWMRSSIINITLLHTYIALLLEYKARWSRCLYSELIVTPRYPTGIDLYALATRFALCILRHCLFVLYSRRL